MSLEVLTANVLEATQSDCVEDLLLLLQQMQEAASLPGDKSCLIGPVVKLLPLHNLEVKKRVYATLQRLCEVHPDAALLAANSVLRDCRDPNPEVKCLGVWGISVLPPLFPLFAADILSAALDDAHPRVRRTAVLSCGRVFSASPGLLEGKGFVDRLYESIRDEDTLVVVQALLVLDRALAQEGGVVVNRKLAQYLLMRLPHFQPAQLATVLQVLRKYTPKTDSELFTQLSLLDPYLAHKESAAVVVNCAQLFVQLIEGGYPHLEKDVIARCVPALTTFLASPDVHAQGYILEFLQWTQNRKMNWLSPFSKSWQLFCPPRHLFTLKDEINRQDSSVNNTLLQKKLLLLPYVCSTENASEVLQSLEEATWNRSNAPLCRAFLDCIATLVENLPQPSSSQALRLLTDFVESRDAVIVENALQALERLDVSNLPEDDVPLLITAIVSSMNIFKDDVLDEATTSGPLFFPAILPQLLSGRRPSLSLQTVVHIVDGLVTHLPKIIDSNCYTFAYQVLHCSMQLFLQEPSSFQQILGRALHICVEFAEVASMNNPIHYLALKQLSKQAMWYYHLLKSDPSMALTLRTLGIQKD